MGRKKKEEESEATEQDVGSPIDRILGQKKFESIRGSVVTAESINKYSERVPTGSLILDLYLDGGYRVGLSRFSGEAEHGKTANALAWAAKWQQHIKNSCVVYVNAEGRVTDLLLKRAGLDLSPEKFRIIHSNVYETVAQIIHDLVIMDEVTRYFFIIDSTDALISTCDQDKQFSDSATIAGGARMASAFTKKTCINIGSRGHHLMMLSQVRANLASKGGPGSGGTTESGGKALTFYSSLTGKIDKMSDFAKSYIYPNDSGEDDDDKKAKPAPIGNYFSVLFTKSFHEKTRQRIRIPIKWGRGVWLEKEIVDCAQMYQLITKKGAGWFEMNDQLVELGLPAKLQGETKIVAFLEENPEVTKKLEAYFRETLIGK